MSLVRRNVAATLAGNAWNIVVTLVTVPVLIKFLGIEAYGLIGLYAAVGVISTILTNGLDVSINRELAHLTGQGDPEQRSRALVRTLEVVYWVIALLIGLTLVAFSPALAGWVKEGDLSPRTVEQAILLMGFGFALQWPSSLYIGGLKGLQRHVRVHQILVAFHTIQSVGAILILWQVSRSVQTFFIWEAVTNALQTGVLAFALWRSLPPGGAAEFRRSELRTIRGFAAAMTGITVLKIVLTQTDKILLSRLLPLDTFGYYVLATTVAVGITRLLAPVPSAFFPRFAELLAQGEDRALRSLYHRGCQFLSVLMLPPAVVLSLFSVEFLDLWTQDPLVVREAHLLTSLLVLGNALNGLLQVPYALQLAHKWTSLTLVACVVAVIVLMPSLAIMAIHFGAVGAALVWVALNTGHVTITIPLMHRRILKGDLSRWYLKDILPPLAAAAAVAGVGRLLFPDDATRLVTAVLLALVSGASAGAALMTVPWLKDEVVTRVTKTLRRQSTEAPTADVS